MLLGHFGIALAAKQKLPRVSLGLLFAASLFQDLICLSLLLFNVESVRHDPGNTVVTPIDFVHYPYSHSLLMAVIWSVAFALIMRAKKFSAQESAWLGILTFSHWLLDWISHGKDLALYPGSSLRLGLGLWNFLVPTIVLEAILMAGGIYLYTRLTSAKNRIGSAGFWGLVFFLVMIYFIVVFFLSAPTKGLLAVSLAGLLLTLAAGHRIDCERKLRS